MSSSLASLNALPLCHAPTHPHTHKTKSPRGRRITDGQVTNSSLIGSTTSSHGPLMGRWYWTVVRDVEDCIREAAARGRGRDFYDIVFTSELPCNPIRTHSCLTIQQFIRSSAHSSHGGNTRMCAINAPCVARNKCTLERLCSRSNPPADIQYAASTQYMPYSTFLPGLVRAFFFVV